MVTHCSLCTFDIKTGNWCFSVRQFTQMYPIDTVRRITETRNYRDLSICTLKIRKCRYKLWIVTYNFIKCLTYNTTVNKKQFIYHLNLIYTPISEIWNYSKSGNSWKYPDLWTDLFPPQFFICIKLKFNNYWYLPVYRSHNFDNLNVSCRSVSLQRKLGLTDRRATVPPKIQITCIYGAQKIGLYTKNSSNILPLISSLTLLLDLF